MGNTSVPVEWEKILNSSVLDFGQPKLLRVVMHTGRDKKIKTWQVHFPFLTQAVFLSSSFECNTR